MATNIEARVRELRKTLKLTQAEFGKRLSVSVDVITNIENGRLARPEQKEPLYKLMCKEFNVNYEWLTMGKGEMFNESQEDFFDKLAERYGLGVYARKVLDLYSSLDDAQKQTLENLIYQAAMCVLENNIAQAQLDILEAAASTKNPKLAGAVGAAFSKAFPYKGIGSQTDSEVAVQENGAASQDNDIAADIKNTIQQTEAVFAQNTTRKK